MGNLERIGENRQPIIEKTPQQEAQEMEYNLIRKAQKIFSGNHELVKEAMLGLGNRKAKEVLENLAKYREETKKAVMRFRKTKEECFPFGLRKFQAADNYYSEEKKAA